MYWPVATSSLHDIESISNIVNIVTLKPIILNMISKIPFQVCIVFTDGQAYDYKLVPGASRSWAQKGAKVYAVGIGKGIDQKGW